MTTEERYFLTNTSGMRFRVDAATYERGKDLTWYAHPRIQGTARTRVDGVMVTLGRFVVGSERTDLQVWRLTSAPYQDADGLYYDFRSANLSVRPHNVPRPKAILSESEVAS